MAKLKMGGGGMKGQALPVLGALLLVVGAWLAWGAWRNWQENAAQKAAGAQRDQLTGALKSALAKPLGAARTAAADPAVVAAVSAGDLATAAQALATTAWPGAENVEIQPGDLQAMMAALPASGYGRTGVAMQAAATGKATAAFAKDKLGKRLVVAAPVNNGAAIVIGAYPMQPFMDVVSKAGGGYVALRQGEAVVVDAGDKTLADAEDARRDPVPDTAWTLQTTSAPVVPGPFGMGYLPAGIAALVALAVGGGLLTRGLRTPNATADAQDDATPMPADAGAMTLEERLALEPRSAPPAVPAAALTAALPGPGAQASDSPAPPAPSDDGLPSRAALDEPLAFDLAPAPVPATASAGAGVAVPDAGIFRAYDIRGVVGKTLNAEVAQQIGQAIGTLMESKGLHDIVVGRDGRLSGPEMAEGLIRGLRSTGRNVIDIGMAPTPVVYFGAYQLRTGCCVAVTGSHNPPDYNGFKIVIGGETLSGDTITGLHAAIAEGRLHSADAQGRLEQRDLAGDYIARIAGDIRLARPMKVVVDAGNGVAGEIGPQVLEAIGATVVPLYCEIDGNFPNHHPDPSEPHNLADLRHMVMREEADLGIAFDGDGDRLGVITPRGRNIFPDRLLMLFAEDVLERNPGAIIVYDVKCTGALAPFVMGRGGSPMMWKTGHSLIKAKMREEEAELAGEMSGHFFFMERWFGFDDGIYSAARLLEILAKQPGDADAVFSRIPDSVATPEIKVPVADPHAFIARLVEGGAIEGARMTTIDGLRADFEDGFGLARASNTTPVVVLRFEASTQERLEAIEQVFRERLHAVDPALTLGF